MLFREIYKNLLMGIPTRTAAILFVVIGMFSLVVVTLYYSAMMSRVYASGTNDNTSGVPNMFSLKNIDCALHSGPCDILHDDKR